MLRKIAIRGRALIYKRASNRDTKVIKELLGQDSLLFVDLGAAGGIEPRWEKISSMLRYVGFEPDSRARENLPNIKFASYELLSGVVGEKKAIQKLYLTNDEGKSSNYHPNETFLNRFQNPGRFTVIKEIDLEANSIDAMILEPMDFIKLDIQGSELNALKGAANSLSSVLGIEAEVEFAELYDKQPLFGSLSEFLKKHDFEFIDFVNLRRWERNSFNGLGQLVFGDGLFLKSPEWVIEQKFSGPEIRKYLCILYLYNRFDLIEKIFDEQPNLHKALQRFYKSHKKKRNTLYSINKFNFLVSGVYKLLGLEYRSHVIY